jgi:glycosyltransferase involved in cell wall biosynthesis
MGSEQSGWALDADMATTRQAFALIPQAVRLTDLAEAEVVHSVWEHPLLALSPDALRGKRILCHVCNDVLRTMEQVCMIAAPQTVGLWIPISRKAEGEMQKLGLRCAYVPYAVDPSLFCANLPEGLRPADLRRQFGLPEKSFIISSFMRDSLGTDLSRPKAQKGVEMFVGIVADLWRRRLPIHVLLAGPRRHWLRAQLRAAGVPFTYVGQVLEGDDNDVNILSPFTLNLLYHVSDLHVVTSRWEGGPRAVLEAAATQTRIISTRVGLAADVLEPECLFSAVDEGTALIERELATGALERTRTAHHQRIRDHHSPQANAERFGRIYDCLAQLPVFEGAPRRSVCPAPEPRTRRWPTRVVHAYRAWRRRHRPGLGLCLGLWHTFQKPPYGGGNQFMLALRGELQKQGARVVSNRLSSRVDVHICNSAWFAVEEFAQAQVSNRLRMIHRLDGPVALYRGTDTAEDERILALNERFASATVCQSGWTLLALHELGLRPRAPVIIHNAVDGRYFHSRGRVPFTRDRKTRLISTAWSDNPNKGGSLYAWLDEHLDRRRFDYTYVGRTKESFQHARHVSPQRSGPLGCILRQHDIYVTASRKDPCSNALIEALACGLPCLYLNDGGHPELVGQGGLSFEDGPGLLQQLDRMVEHYERFQACIWIEGIDEIARRYIALVERVLSP